MFQNIILFYNFGIRSVITYLKYKCLLLSINDDEGIVVYNNTQNVSI